MCASGVEKCAQTWSSTRVAKLTPNASIGWRTVVSCGHAGVGVDVGKYDGPMI